MAVPSFRRRLKGEALADITRRGFLMLGAGSCAGLASCAARPAPEEPADEASEGQPTEDDAQQPEPAAPVVVEACLFSAPQTVDPALCPYGSGATVAAHLFAGLARWASVDGAPAIVPDVAESLPEPQDNGDGTVTLTYTIRDSARWSDGQFVNAQDFVFSWDRAARLAVGTERESLFRDVVGFSDLLAWAAEGAGEGADYDGARPSLAVAAVDEVTLAVTLARRGPHWDEALASPCLFPVREDVVRFDGWSTDPSMCISNGAFTLAGWEAGSVITLDANPYYHDAALVGPQTLELFLSEDVANRVSNFDNGTWQVVDVTSLGGTPALVRDHPRTLVTSRVAATYAACWDVNREVLPASPEMGEEDYQRAQAALRRAVCASVDRDRLADEVLMAGQAPARSLVPWCVRDAADDYNVGAPHVDEVEGLPDDPHEAAAARIDRGRADIAALVAPEGEGADAPALSVSIARGPAELAIGADEFLLDALVRLGFDAELVSSARDDQRAVVAAQPHDITCVDLRAPLLDPACFLEAFTSTSDANCCGLGTGRHASAAIYDLDLGDLGLDVHVEGGTWSETYDLVVGMALDAGDSGLRVALLRRAEALLVQTGAVCPLFLCADALLLGAGCDAVLTSPMGTTYLHGVALP